VFCAAFPSLRSHVQKPGAQVHGQRHLGVAEQQAHGAEVVVEGHDEVEKKRPGLLSDEDGERGLAQEGGGAQIVALSGQGRNSERTPRNHERTQDVVREGGDGLDEPLNDPAQEVVLAYPVFQRPPVQYDPVVQARLEDHGSAGGCVRAEGEGERSERKERVSA
jgi:hypothetical protein